ncbi:glycosyltransferase family 32 protein [Bacteroides fragilis]|uniref:glycosyltransferase family 32 protein n=1 Tax=Bacteroides fragilis TaxID=817 RepID=UPI001C708221|nr:glycosyltransferase [Bacteroides fragilis]MBW9278510.1 glycosyl transferase [Bacteroides fragilis]
MIPKKIHYCWFGKGKMPELALKCIESWRVNLPDYELKEWNENSFDINSNFYVKEAYESRKFAFVTDYVRLYALYTEGGIYMDTDVEVLKNLDSFLGLPAFSGFEDNVHIPTGIMAAEKGSIWAKWQLEYYSDRHFLLPDGTLDLTTNVDIIGGLMEEKGFILKNGLYNFQNIITIFPKDYFCPKSHTTGKIELTENTYTIHHFAGSWKSSSDRLKRRIVHLIGVKTVHRLKLLINLFR